MTDRLPELGELPAGVVPGSLAAWLDSLSPGRGPYVLAGLGARNEEYAPVQVLFLSPL